MKFLVDLIFGKNYATDVNAGMKRDANQMRPKTAGGAFSLVELVKFAEVLLEGAISRKSRQELQYIYLIFQFIFTDPEKSFLKKLPNAAP